MAEFREQIDEIKSLFSSENKALAYSKLLHLQEISAVDSSAVGTLAGSSHVILSYVVVDISCNEEEIAAQALKCLGFMIYHPAIVPSIEGNDAGELIESLVKVVVTTKIKSVCNLGVWCISIQQLSTSLLDRHFHSLLRAVTHALDNPIGSLSITFEAMQAVVKLASSLTERMRESSSLWIPPIYRRLVSLDKRDRDLSERYLLRIMPLICPLPVSLSKALATDMKKKLLLALKELLDQGMKIQSLQAWRWFIRLLGPYALKNKHLVNEMLTILEHTFSDFDSQVQIASLVAWEGLIDALIEPRVQAIRSNSTLGHDVQVLGTSEAERHLKGIKLIMAPLIGIMSSKCDVSVRASCLSTWSYLLHKLEASLDCQSLIRTVWEPIIEVVFQVGPDNNNIWLWNFCLDHLDTLVSGTNQGTDANPYNREPHQLPHNNMAFGKCQFRHYPISCSPWNISQLEFFIKMISIIVNRESDACVTPEFSRVASDASLRLFGSLLEAVQRALRRISITYDNVMQCLNTIFRFLRKMCENVMSEDDGNCTCAQTCLKFIKVVIERLGPSILESPLYKVGLEIKCLRKLKHITEIRCAAVPDICFRHLEDRVLPVVSLSMLHFSVVNSSLEAPGYESVLQQLQGYLKLLLFSFNPQEVLHAFTSLLYKNTVHNSLQIWVVLVNCLKELIDGVNNPSILKMEMDNIDYSVLLHLLSYPFASWSLSDIKLDHQIVIEVWKSLYLSVDQASQPVNSPAKSFSEDLCAILNECINQITSVDNELKEKKCSDEFFLLCGNVVTCILKQLTWSLNSEGRLYTDCRDRNLNITSRMHLVAWVMKLFWANKQRSDISQLSVASRFLEELVNFVGCLHRKEDVLLFIETISNPLLEWLYEMHLLDVNTSYQLQLLWTQMLRGLQQTQPSITFNYSFLEFQELLLERALDHPNPTISEATINFWNSTYGEQSKLEFPKNLVPLLDKLSRNGRIKICSRNHYGEDCISLRKCSKRVEIVGNPVHRSLELDNIRFGAKRKRAELTDHQKEVRRAQQGRGRDSSGHGPGIRTYTNVDFSQENEESQDI
ncbi:hypothetical protein ACS0TY_021276 [Phlomoides rotata]